MKFGPRQWSKFPQFPKFNVIQLPVRGLFSQCLDQTHVLEHASLFFWIFGSIDNSIELEASGPG